MSQKVDGQGTKHELDNQTRMEQVADALLKAMEAADKLDETALKTLIRAALLIVGHRLAKQRQ